MALAPGECCDPVVLAQTRAAAPLGGTLIPARQVYDPFPVFNGIAVDARHDLVVMTDVNRKSLLVYDRSTAAAGAGETPPRRQIMGPETNIGFVAGVLLDPERREIYAVNNDIEDTMLVMPYAAEGNAKPARLLSVPHQAWGLALSRSRDEIAVTAEIQKR